MASWQSPMSTMRLRRSMHARGDRASIAPHVELPWRRRGDELEWKLRRQRELTIAGHADQRVVVIVAKRLFVVEPRRPLEPDRRLRQRRALAHRDRQVPKERRKRHRYHPALVGLDIRRVVHVRRGRHPIAVWLERQRDDARLLWHRGADQIETARLSIEERQVHPCARDRHDGGDRGYRTHEERSTLRRRP